MKVNKERKYVLRKSKVAKGLCSLAFGVALVSGSQYFDANEAKAADELLSDSVATEAEFEAAFNKVVLDSSSTSTTTPIIETPEEKVQREELVRKNRQLEGELAKKKTYVEVYSEAVKDYAFEDGKLLDKDLDTLIAEEVAKPESERHNLKDLLNIKNKLTKLNSEISKQTKELEDVSLALEKFGDRKNISVEYSEKEKELIAKEKTHIENDFSVSAYHNENYVLKNGKTVPANVVEFNVSQEKFSGELEYYVDNSGGFGALTAKNVTKGAAEKLESIMGDISYYYGIPKSAKIKSREDFLSGTPQIYGVQTNEISLKHNFEVINKQAEAENKEYLDGNYYSSSLVSYRPINVLNHLDEFEHVFLDDNDPNKVYVIKGILLDKEVAVLKELGIEVPKHIKVVTEEEAKAMATSYEGIEKISGDFRVRSLKLKYYDRLNVKELKAEVSVVKNKFFKDNKDNDYKVYEVEISRPEKLNIGYQKEDGSFEKEIVTDPLVYEKNDKFTVTIKIHVGLTPVAVYYLDEVGNTVEKIAITVEGNNLKFVTSHFSKYIIEYAKSEEKILDDNKKEESVKNEKPIEKEENQTNVPDGNKSEEVFVENKVDSTLISSVENNNAVVYLKSKDKVQSKVVVNDESASETKKEKVSYGKSVVKSNKEKTLPKTSAVQHNNNSVYNSALLIMSLGLLSLVARRKFR